MNSQELRALQEAYMEVAMNEGKQKYPYAKVTDQLRNKEGDAYRTSKTNPKEGERKEKEHLRHQKIHDRVKNLPYHEIGRTENRLKDSEKDNKPQKYFPNRLRRADGQGIKDSYEYDLYDIILSHLLDEGYAETQEQAQVIMVNMSEDWRESIIEEQTDPLKTASENAAKRNTAYGSKKFQDGLKLSPSNPNSPNFDPKTLKTPGV